VFGDASLGWLDAAMLWGASVEIFVCHGGNVKHLVGQLYPDVFVAPMATAVELPPHHCWDGLLVGTLSGAEDGNMLAKRMESWRPGIFVISCLAAISRRELHRLTDFTHLGYSSITQHRCNHQ
jgi:hypothetical protein